MKFDFTKIEEDFEFKKQIINTEKTNLKNILFKTFKRTGFFLSTVSVISLFLLINNISFQQQQDFVMQSKFNTSLLIFYSLYLTFTIIVGTLSTAQDGKKLSPNFNSVWIPIKMALFTSILLPIQADGASIFSQSIVETIKILDKFF